MDAPPTLVRVMPGLPTGIVTFLFTDIEGSTRLADRLGDWRHVPAHPRRMAASLDVGVAGSGRAGLTDRDPTNEEGHDAARRTVSGRV